MTLKSFLYTIMLVVKNILTERFLTQMELMNLEPAIGSSHKIQDLTALGIITDQTHLQTKSSWPCLLQDNCLEKSCQDPLQHFLEEHTKKRENRNWTEIPTLPLKGEIVSVTYIREWNTWRSHLFWIEPIFVIRTMFRLPLWIREASLM